MLCLLASMTSSYVLNIGIAGFNTGGGNVNFKGFANHVYRYRGHVSLYVGTSLVPRASPAPGTFRAGRGGGGGGGLLCVT